MAFQQGSFRGVKFRTESHSTGVGRRKAIYEIPFDDKGVAGIDLGRRARRYRINCFVLGTDRDDAISQRDKLLEALEKRGAGLLVHPDLGPVNVEIPNEPIDVSWNNDAINKYTFGFVAVEAREPAAKTPSISLGGKGGVLKAARDLGDAIGDAMETGVSVDGVSDFVAAANIEVLDNVLDGLRDINGDINALLSVPGNIAGQIDAISRELSELLQTPRKLFDAIDGLMDSIAQSVQRVLPGGSRDSLGSLSRAVSAASALGATVRDVPDVLTLARDRQRKNQGAIILNSKANMLRRLAQNAADLDFDSADSAQAASRALRNAMSAVLEETNNGQELAPAVRRAMLRLRTATQQHLATRAGTLVQLTTYTPPETLPASVIAHVLYGDATRAAEIIARNPHITHPGFVPGGVPIEVVAA